jgi:hypothetical protein
MTWSGRYAHLILVLDEELDSLDRGGGRLCDGGRHASHQEVGHERLEVLGLFDNLSHDAGSADISGSPP